MFSRSIEYRSRIVAGAIVALALVTGCGSKGTPPAAEVATARSALTQAESAGAREHAPHELLNAREKLAQAEAAMQVHDYDRALRLSEQAAVDAHLAEAKAGTARSQRAVAELQKSIDTLRSELERRPNQ